MSMSIDRANRDDSRARRYVEERRRARKLRDDAEEQRISDLKKARIEALQTKRALEARHAQLEADRKREFSIINARHVHIHNELLKAKIKIIRLKELRK